MLVYLFVMYINVNKQKLIFVKKCRGFIYSYFAYGLQNFVSQIFASISANKEWTNETLHFVSFNITLHTYFGLMIMLEQFKIKLEKIILIEKPTDYLLFWSLGGSMMSWIKGISWVCFVDQLVQNPSVPRSSHLRQREKVGLVRKSFWFIF